MVMALAVQAAALRPVEKPARDFWPQPALDAVLDVANFDRALMTAAIFHETNRVRLELKLPVFRTLPKLDEAADLEAAVGKVYQPPSHTNPFPLIGSPAARVKYVGLEASRVAENIALLSIYEVDPNVGVGVALRGGRKHFVDPRTQADLPPTTYRRFAARVVQAWMNSPGHRANIVDPNLTCLGCSVQPTINILGVDNLFCVQVFFTPGD
jgi:uncharacterized protein YkwD